MSSILSLHDFRRILSGWKRNEYRNTVSKSDIAIMCAWNYERVDKKLFFDALSSYNLSTEHTDIKEFINQTLY